MEVKVCVGSACYVKGSHDVIQRIEQLIKQYRLEKEVILKAAFCLGHCTDAVSVEIDDVVYGVDRHEVDDFFKVHVIGRINQCK